MPKMGYLRLPVLCSLNTAASALLAWIGKPFLADQITFLRQRIQVALTDHKRCLEKGIPNPLIKALIVGEDKRFWQHAGVDILAIARAVVYIIIYRHLQGASTIEQQLVRTLTGYRKLTLRRKLREMALACIIGTFLGKKEIATLYLCCAYYGWRMNSLKEACQRMGFDLEKLSLAEAADLVARLKYPEPKLASAGSGFLISKRAAYILRKAQRVTV